MNKGLSRDTDTVSEFKKHTKEQSPNVKDEILTAFTDVNRDILAQNLSRTEVSAKNLFWLFYS